jgi:hypothetical protein
VPRDLIHFRAHRRKRILKISNNIDRDKQKKTGFVDCRSGPNGAPGHEMNDRQDKRESAKKSREFSVYSKKAVRAKEALLDKKGLGTKSHGPDTEPLKK